MNFSGQFNQLSWVGDSQEWFSLWSQPRQQCEVYRYCGEFGICQHNASVCTCLNGFQPRSPLDWNLNEFSGGCVRKTSLQCGDDDRFLPVHLVIETSNQRLNDDIETADNCEQSCLNDCSCNAYAYNTSCLLWNESLFNLQRFQDGNGGISIQLRLAASEIPSPEGKKPLKAYIIVLIAVSILICILGCFLFAYKMKQRGKIKYRIRETSPAVFSIDREAEQGKLELPSFDLSTVAAATNNFSNKLGQGGFGSVYKGKLQDEHFGMARIFGGKQTLANTNRVVGTYGYMSPEYAMEGTFSEKSDVFSFGVMVLEIVSSKKNSNFYFLEESYNLLGYVWQKWNVNKVFEIMDPTLSDSYNLQELLRCIHIGLLCVQDHFLDRPTMSAIVSMLGSEGALPLPKQPAFTIERKTQLSDILVNINDAVSINLVTITKPEGR
ncbi:Cysteine-rich receptor-like protein kinase [Thalictrum thalictroides]|uniref:Cysteine-rich receptor-like protein kinase n=1 Tax=Thalictrum thalictroides TaxID=46969 RepID=A0A7J6WG86_THATH|nr:Cysteine-rich receptor-like protein kinase [Thalictrum thalictroides]